MHNQTNKLNVRWGRSRVRPPFTRWATSALVVVLLGVVGSQAMGQVAPEAVPFPQIPLVDEELPPEQIVLDITLGLYDAVLASDPACPSLAKSLSTYLDEHATELEEASKELQGYAASMDEASLSELATFFAAGIERPETYGAQDKLYRCLRSNAAQGRGRPVEKQMRRFFRLHGDLLLTIVGPVD